MIDRYVTVKENDLLELEKFPGKIATLEQEFEAFKDAFYDVFTRQSYHNDVHKEVKLKQFNGALEYYREKRGLK